MSKKKAEKKPLPSEFDLTIFVWKSHDVLNGTGYSHKEVRKADNVTLMYIVQQLFNVYGLNVMLRRNENNVYLFVSDSHFGQS